MPRWAVATSSGCATACSAASRLVVGRSQAPQTIELPAPLMLEARCAGACVAAAEFVACLLATFLLKTAQNGLAFNQSGKRPER